MSPYIYAQWITATSCTTYLPTPYWTVLIKFELINWTCNSPHRLCLCFFTLSLSLFLSLYCPSNWQMFCLYFAHTYIYIYIYIYTVASYMIALFSQMLWWIILQFLFWLPIIRFHFFALILCLLEQFAQSTSNECGEHTFYLHRYAWLHSIIIIRRNQTTMTLQLYHLNQWENHLSAMIVQSF